MFSHWFFLPFLQEKFLWLHQLMPTLWCGTRDCAGVIGRGQRHPLVISFCCSYADMPGCRLELHPDMSLAHKSSEKRITNSSKVGINLNLDSWFNMQMRSRPPLPSFQHWSTSSHRFGPHPTLGSIPNLKPQPPHNTQPYSLISSLNFN